MATRQLQEDAECGRTRIDDRHEPINSQSSLSWSHSDEPSSVSETASAPCGAAEDAYGGARCGERGLRGRIRESKPVQSGVQAILWAATDARYPSIASYLVIAKYRDVSDLHLRHNLPIEKAFSASSLPPFAPSIQRFETTDRVLPFRRLNVVPWELLCRQKRIGVLSPGKSRTRKLEIHMRGNGVNQDLACKRPLFVDLPHIAT